MTGEWPGTMELTEPQAGSDVGAVRTHAEPQPDGSFRLTGTKIFISWGDHDLAENIIHLVLARTPGSPPGTKGLSLFLVPKYLVNADGSPGSANDIRCALLEHKLGLHASPTAVLAYGGDEGAAGWLVGGETVANPERLFIGVSLVGEIARDKCILRSGASVGDGVWVTGELGGSIAGHHLEFTPRLAEARWLAAHHQPSAMIDLSDGLAGDLGHLLHEANAGAELLESALPIRREARLRARESEAAKPPLLAALTDGEDYELCFTLGQGRAVTLLDQFKQEFPGTPLSCVGKIVDRPGLKIRQKSGIMEIATRGHVHFQ